MKRCSCCGNQKADDDFRCRNKSKCVRYGTCKDCQRIYESAWYVNHRDERRRYLVKSNKDRARRNAELVCKYLEDHPCVDCGEADLIVLEFDHVRGDKSANIARLIYQGGRESVLAEIMKCDVVCANCHRRRTAKAFWHADTPKLSR
jgi:hypothetical protein